MGLIIGLTKVDISLFYILKLIFFAEDTILEVSDLQNCL
jgi:hypothetical protein